MKSDFEISVAIHEAQKVYDNFNIDLYLKLLKEREDGTEFKNDSSSRWVRPESIRLHTSLYRKLGIGKIFARK
jgi:hypothetical protein